MHQGEVMSAQDTQLNILKHIKHTELDLRIVLMAKRFTIGKLITLSPGAILMFDKTDNDKAELYVNERHIATGKVVQVDEHYGLQITNFPEAPSSS